MELGSFTPRQIKLSTAVLLASAALSPAMVGCGEDEPSKTDSCAQIELCNKVQSDVEKAAQRNAEIQKEIDKINSTTPAAPPPTSTQPKPNNDPYANGECTPGLQPDQDADNIPDVCDQYYDPNNKDSDMDGLPDSRDDYPNDNDANNNGTDDGYDSSYCETCPNLTDPTG